MRTLQLLALALLATATPCCADSLPFVYDTTTNTFSSNPDPGSTGSGYSPAFGINDSGQIVGEYIDDFGSDHGYLYSSGVSRP
jgi:probable HAF family extracellular repeat protein